MRSEEDLKQERREDQERRRKAREYDEILRTYGTAVAALGAAIRSTPKTGVLLSEMRIRLLPGSRGDYLCIIKADTLEGPRVGFVSGASPVDALCTACRAVGANQVTWRVEKPYVPRSPGPEEA